MIQDTNIIYNVKEGAEPAPYTEKIKSTDALNADGSLDLYIVHTNDVHGHIDPEEGGIGYSSLSAFLNILKVNARGNLLTLDAGDSLHGSNIANFFNGEDIANLLGYMGYDAVTLGSHDFEYGLKQLNTNLIIEMAREAVPVSNNIKVGGRRVLPPYRIFNFSGYKVAVIGLTTPATASQSNPRSVEGVSFEDGIIEDLQKTVDKARKESDFVVVLGSIGLEPVGSLQLTSTSICRDVKGIDLFVDGNSHTALDKVLYEGTIPVVQAGEYLNNVGVIKLHISPTFRIESFDYQLISKDNFDNPQNSEFLTSLGINATLEDQAVNDYVAGKKVALNEVYRKPIAVLSEKYDSSRTLVRAEQCPLGKLVADAISDAMGTDFGIINGDSFKTDLGPDTVTIGDVNSTLPYNNYVVLSEITGSKLYEAMENGYSLYPELSGAFPQTNLIVSVDTDQPMGSRVLSLSLPNGTYIPKNDVIYKVATIDYLAMGNDGYTQFGSILRHGRQINEVVIDYLSNAYPIN